MASSGLRVLHEAPPVAGGAERFHYLDAARSVLMTLGIVFHAAFIYAIGAQWRIHDPSGGPAFDAIVGFVHVFRMPAFFMIAGFFCVLTLARYGPDGFYRRRVLRIGVPLAFTAIVLNSVQAMITDSTADLVTSSYWLEGGWVSHLWFLVDLLIYVTIAYLLAKMIGVRSTVSRLVDRLIAPLTGPRSFPAFVLLLLPALGFLLLAAGKFFPQLHEPFFDQSVITLYDLARYGLFFLVGALLFIRRDLLTCFEQPPSWLFGVLGLAVVLHLALPESEDLGVRLFLHYVDTVIDWLACSLIFFIFRVWFSRPSRSFAYLADASYTIYLTHHFIVIVLGLLLLHVPLAAAAKFTIVVLTTFGLTLSIHHFLVLRHRFLSLLLNGKLRPGTVQTRLEPSFRPSRSQGATAVS